jgi:hypothetical protein
MQNLLRRSLPSVIAFAVTQIEEGVLTILLIKNVLTFIALLLNDSNQSLFLHCDGSSPWR